MLPRFKAQLHEEIYRKMHLLEARELFITNIYKQTIFGPLVHLTLFEAKEFVYNETEEAHERKKPLTVYST